MTLLDSPTTVQRRTRVRFAVVTLLVLLGVVTYLDRACIGTLEDPIMEDLGISKYELSWAHTAFAASYAAFGILAAWWGDRVGTRIMLTAVVLGWSAFTMGTGAATGLVSLIVVRFCFGAAEAGAWPAITRTLSRWIPYRERGTTQGIVWFGAHGTAALTPLLIHEMRTDGVAWRAIFALFGVVGLVWAAVWYWWFRDEPSQHPQVNETEREYIMSDRNAAGDCPNFRDSVHSEAREARQSENGTVPFAAEEPLRGRAFWLRLLTHRNVIALCLMYMPNGFIFYFCITWFHKFLSENRGLEGRELAFFTGLPLLLSVAGDVLGGITTDWAVRHFGPRWGRAGVGFTSYLVAGASVLLAAFIGDARTAATFFALGTAANMFILGSAWATCQDIGGNHAGVVSATMNTAGQIGAMICPILVIFVASHFGWNADLKMIGVTFLVFSLCWLFVDPRKKVFA